MGPNGRCVVFTWAGVQLDDAAIGHLLQRQWGADMVARHHVGELDVSSDTAALTALDRHDNIDQVMLIVEAWQPPIGDYVDFVAQLRHKLGDGPMIWVLLYSSRSARPGHPATPERPGTRAADIGAHRCLAACQANM
jgi:Protein of unknown function (DUF2868)